MGDFALHVAIFLRQLWALPRNVRSYCRENQFKPGDIYLDCNWTPVVVTKVDRYALYPLGPWEIDLVGISLVDGSFGHGCSTSTCAPEKIEPRVAEHIVSLMLGRSLDLECALAQREAGVANIRRIYDNSPELQRLWG